MLTATMQIPEQLLKKAKQKSHIKETQKIVIQALEDFVNKPDISQLKKYKGKIDLDINLDVLRDRKI
ncbi:MAG: type II toxin-antitoxin system VapB family antitoxin [Gammaproteobacteria bacterium]|nr:MAG: type II toxin-antitoxin system VapB family antitoxin [Gammaproteobacteria bacterium]